ncbi:adenylosuccinate synthetase-like [Tropilaelaps mercedesae]|uniref:Adenylosuccinate synthetase n=1 Tax=Tropilaelaps mercedesae TaxID=418985 RepID=A0A1V9XWE0_9ACAR|nr:adenylosuccinate synthetase-like [Tropilaelaps mercedesae]
MHLTGSLLQLGFEQILSGICLNLHSIIFGVRERQMKMARNSITVVLGSQWGDEGKGKLVDTLASEVDVVARCQGGNNAGHTVVVDGAHYHFHLIPGGMIHKSCIGVIGNGCVVHPGQIIEEINNLHANGLNLTGRLFISNRAHIVFDFHQQCDGLHEAEKSKRHQKLGTTKKGIGPTYSSKAQRNGMRMCDLIGDWKVFETKFRTLVEFHQRMFTDLQVDVAEDLKRLKLNADRLRPFVCDTVSYIHDAIREGKRIMVEGANAAMLDIDFGTYPYVTSSNCTVGGVCTGIGIPPSFIGTVYGVFKAYCTRVGDGPFPTELTDELGKLLQDRGSERGVTTGRPRRCGWLDIVMLRYSTLVNGYTAFCLTKLDIFDVLDEVKIAHKYRVGDAVLNCPPASLDELAKVQVEYVTLPGWKTSTEECRRFEDLPENAKNYVRTCEGLLGVRVQYIGVGKSRADIIKVF